MKKEFWRGKRVLVTGHEGFIGSWLTRILVASGARLVGLDKVKNRPGSLLQGLRSRIKGVRGDVADRNLVRKIIATYRPKVVFHLAAQAIVGESYRDPRETFHSNIEGTWNVLEACRRRRFIEAIVIASSDKAYGVHKELPYREEAPLKGDHPYDVSKSCADLLAYTYFNTYHLPVSVTRCGNVFGPGDTNFSRIVPDALRSIIRSRPLLIRSDGKFTRDYIYVEDVVSGYMLLAEKMKKRGLYGQAFNFSNERPMSVLGLFGRIIKATGERKIKPRILGRAEYEIKDQYLSARKARKVLGWRPRYNLEEGLAKTIPWYRELLRSKK